MVGLECLCDESMCVQAPFQVTTPDVDATLRHAETRFLTLVQHSTTLLELEQFLTSCIINNTVFLQSRKSDSSFVSEVFYTSPLRQQSAIILHKTTYRNIIYVMNCDQNTFAIYVMVIFLRDRKQKKTSSIMYAIYRTLENTAYIFWIRIKQQIRANERNAQRKLYLNLKSTHCKTFLNTFIWKLYIWAIQAFCVFFGQSLVLTSGSCRVWRYQLITTGRHQSAVI